MIDFTLLALTFAAGVVLGLLFFGGLWWTLEHHLRSQNSMLWLLGSMLVRLILLMLGLFLVASGDWCRVLIALAGIMIGRSVITQLARFSQPLKPHGY